VDPAVRGQSDRDDMLAPSELVADLLSLLPG
jgi:hypothetical protein